MAWDTPGLDKAAATRLRVSRLELYEYWTLFSAPVILKFVHGWPTT